MLCFKYVCLLSVVQLLFTLWLFLFPSLGAPPFTSTSSQPWAFGAQVPSWRSGLTFNPEFCSISPSSITWAEPHTVEHLAVPGSTGPKLLGRWPSRSQSTDLVCTRQLLPGTPLRGDCCEYLFRGIGELAMGWC